MFLYAYPSSYTRLRNSSWFVAVNVVARFLIRTSAFRVRASLFLVSPGKFC